MRPRPTSRSSALSVDGFRVSSPEGKPAARWPRRCARGLGRAMGPAGSRRGDGRWPSPPFEVHEGSGPRFDYDSSPSRTDSLEQRLPVATRNERVLGEIGRCRQHEEFGNCRGTPYSVGLRGLPCVADARAQDLPAVIDRDGSRQAVSAFGHGPCVGSVHVVGVARVAGSGCASTCRECREGGDAFRAYGARGSASYPARERRCSRP